MVHPQKRADVKVVLQYVIRRIIELKVHTPTYTQDPLQIQDIQSQGYLHSISTTNTDHTCHTHTPYPLQTQTAQPSGPLHNRASVSLTPTYQSPCFCALLAHSTRW